MKPERLLIQRARAPWAYLAASLASAFVGCALLDSAANEVSDCISSTDCLCSEYCKVHETGVQKCTPGCQDDTDCLGNGDYDDGRCGTSVYPAHECVNGECTPPCDYVRCGGKCCDGILAVCNGETCCESGTVCGGKCCSNPDACCGDACCDELCVATGNDCSHELCCGETVGESVCVSSICMDSCSPLAPCPDGCCIALVGGGGACMPSQYCGTPCPAPGCDCCVNLVDGGSVCVPHSFCPD